MNPILLVCDTKYDNIIYGCGTIWRRGIIYLKYGSHLSDILALHMSTFTAISTSKGQQKKYFIFVTFCMHPSFEN